MKGNKANSGYRTALVSEREMFLFRGMFPDYLLKGNILILGAYNGDNEPAGACLMEVTEENVWRITFIYVNRQDRGHGVMSLLLDHVEAAAAKDGAVLSIEFELQTGYGLLFDYIFNKRGYRMSESAVAKWLVTRDMLLNSPLAGNTGKPAQKSDRIIPLREVTNVQIDKLLKSAEESGRSVSAEEIDEAEIDLSRALVIDGEVVGLMLLEPMKEIGVFALTLVYVSQNYISLAPMFFKSAMKEILKEYFYIEKVMFCCQDDEVNALAKKMIGDDSFTAERIVINAVRLAG